MNGIAFFHSKMPKSPGYSDGTDVYSFLDAAHTKSNSSDVFHVNEDGGLQLRKPGTYLANVEVSLEEMTKSSGPSFVSGGFQLSVDGKQMKILGCIFSEVSLEAIALRTKMMQASTIVHVGDDEYGGLEAYEGSLDFRMTRSGYTSVARVQITIQKIG